MMGIGYECKELDGRDTYNVDYKSLPVEIGRNFPPYARALV
jgi:hypothetical protein